MNLITRVCCVLLLAAALTGTAGEAEANSAFILKCGKGVKYTTFFLERPLRLIIDLEETRSQMSVPAVSPNDPYVKTIRYYNLSSSSISRVEIALKKKPGYSIEHTSNGLRVNLTKSKKEQKEIAGLKAAISEKETLLKKREKQITKLRKTISKLKGDHTEAGLRGFLTKWLDAWQNKEIETYISLYSTDFTGRAMNRDQWRAYKERTFETYESIIVKPENIEISIKGNRGKIEYFQYYYADAYRDVGRKRLSLRHNGTGWEVIKESWKPVKLQITNYKLQIKNE